MNQQQLEAILADSDSQASQRYSIHVFDTVSSTNTILWQLLAQGAKPGTIAIATQQTAGRGQWGHQWSSAAGGLYLSMAIAPQHLSAAQGYQLTLCSAWGVATALRDRGIPVKIKWLNDLMLNERKLGGILTETKVAGEQITQAVVGVGINWNNLVPETGISLQPFVANLPETIDSLEMLAAITIIGMTTGCGATPEKIAAVIPAYENLLVNLGCAVTIHDRRATIIGVTPTGNLRVRYEDNNTESFAPSTISLGYG